VYGATLVGLFAICGLPLAKRVFTSVAHILIGVSVFLLLTTDIFKEGIMLFPDPHNLQRIDYKPIFSSCSGTSKLIQSSVKKKKKKKRKENKKKKKKKETKDSNCLWRDD
jgi:hypothetical protein